MVSLAGHVLIWPFLDGVEWDRDATELNGLVTVEGLWDATVPRLLCNRSGQNMG